MATITTGTAAYPWRPDQSMHDPGDVVPDALILSASNIAGEIEGDEPSLRVALIDDASAAFFAEAEEITESEPSLSEVVVHCAKIAQLVRLSNQQMRQTQTPEQLARSVARAITRAADAAFISQVAPTPPAVAPPAGLLHIEGVVDGVEVGANLDPLVDLVAQLESNGSEPTMIIMDPLGYAEIAKIKTDSTDSNLSLVGAGVGAPARTLLGLPVVKNRFITPYSGVVVDKNAITSAVGPIRVDTDTSTYFKYDSCAVRATWTLGWNCTRPDRVGRFTVTEPGS